MNELTNFNLIPVMAEGGDYLFFIVLAVFGVIKFLTSKGSSNEDENSPSKRPRSSSSSSQEGSNTTSDLQAEIRRRIAERMAEAARMAEQAQGTKERPASVPGTLRSEPMPRREFTATTTNAPASDDDPWHVSKEESQSSSYDASSRRGYERPASSSSHTYSLQDDMFAQLEEARKKQKEAKEKMRRVLEKEKSILGEEERGQGFSHSSISPDMLKNPGALRDAIVLSEVLGLPVSQRKGGTCPGMSQ